MAKYIPSPRDWLREQVELYENSGGTKDTAERLRRVFRRLGAYPDWLVAKIHHAEFGSPAMNICCSDVRALMNVIGKECLHDCETDLSAAFNEAS